MLHRLDRGPQPNGARDGSRARGDMSAVESTIQAVPDYAEGAEPLGSAFDLRSIVGVLLRRWKLVLAIPVTAVILTGLGLSFVAPKYKSTVEILAADPRRPSNVAEERHLSSLDVDAAAIESRRLYVGPSTW